MGILSSINNMINTIKQAANGDEYKRSQQFVIMDGSRLVDMVTMCSDNLSSLHLLVQAKQHCTITNIETVLDDHQYKIHCKDKKGNYKLFKFERMYK